MNEIDYLIERFRRNAEFSDKMMCYYKNHHNKNRERFHEGRRGAYIDAADQLNLVLTGQNDG